MKNALKLFRIAASVSTLFVLVMSAFAANPVPFLGQPLLPDATSPGGPGFMLTVNGVGFVATSVVNWNGSPRTTSFVSGSQLTATILASDIVTASTASVTVTSPGPGGGTSDPIFFPISVEASSVTLSLNNFASGNLAFTVLTGDFNHDGFLDIATGNVATSTVSVLSGYGDGTFGQHVDYQTGGGCGFGGFTTDVNHDGNLDLVVPCNGVSVLLGKGDGTFGAAMGFQAGVGSTNVTVGDFNGDGFPDLAVSNGDSNSVSILVGYGDGTFGPPTDYPVGKKPFTIATDDFNHDGKLDLVTANLTGNSISVLLGNGDGTFQPQTEYLTGRDAQYVSVADFNGDNNPDLAVANEDDNTIAIMLGKGDGTFGTPAYLAAGANPSGVIPVDLNGDGKLDLAVADSNYDRGGSSQLSVFLGNGDGTFQPRTDYLTGFGPRTVVAGDFNGDGRLDLATANNDSANVSILLQQSVVFSRQNVIFPTLMIGVASSPLSITMTNVGSSSLNITGITVVGANSGDFAQTNNCGTSLVVGASCTIKTTFTPTAIGKRIATLSVSDDGAGSPQTVSLAGIGTEVSLSPTSLNFGNEPVGVTSTAQDVTLSNNGTTVLTINSISMAGANPKDYAQTNTCGSSLVAGSSCTIHVTFTPTKTGKRPAVLKVLDNGGGAPQYTHLCGTGT
jgi:hypothetical protein